MEGPAAGLPQPRDVLAAAAEVGPGRHLAPGVADDPRDPGREGPSRLGRGLRGRELCSRKKRGSRVGKTKRGKGTKWMVVVDGAGVPLGITTHSASPAEVRLAPETLEAIRVPRAGPGRPRSRPQRLIADKGYDSDPFRNYLASKGIELIAPHRCNRKKPATQDGRPLRRYRRRWKIERTFAWMGNFRRLVVRWDRSAEIYQAFLHVACLLISLRAL